MAKNHEIQAESSGLDDSLMKEKYMQMQMIDQQIQGLQKYMETFDQQLVDIKSLVDSIKEFSQLKKGDEILAPIASGVFLKAKLEDNSELLVNVGNGVVVNKTIAETIALLQSQEKELLSYRSETTVQLEALMKEAEKLQ